jgi:hypothetical protein
MDFKNIREVFAEHNLRPPTLNVLIPDAHFYETLAVQPRGEIALRPDFIGHADPQTAVSQFSDFLRLAIEKESDVVLSPEYSCPWEVLTNAITQQSLPQAGKIWMLGCEAITPNDLRAVISAHANVVWIHEPIPAGTGRFLDVLVYATKTETTSRNAKDVIVLQFKTQAMGGNTFERDHLICGRRIYIWHNPQDNIRLISLICSDALTFDLAAAVDCQFDLHPYLIFHPQLNEDPRHPDISAYRDQLFGRRVSDRIEILTLNWARGFKIQDCAPSHYGGSAIYTKSPEFQLSDTRLEANHQMGLFYTFWRARRTHLCFFSFGQHVFHYRMPKTLQNVKAVLAQRTGPEMLSLRHWDAPTGAWRDSVNSDDGFAQLCGSFQQHACDYCSNAPHTAVECDATIHNHTFGVQAGPLLRILGKCARVVIQVREFLSGPMFRYEIACETPDDFTRERCVGQLAWNVEMKCHAQRWRFVHPFRQSFEKSFAIVDGVAHERNFTLGILNECVNSRGSISRWNSGNFRP